MIIKHKKIKCDVSKEHCYKLTCYSPHKYTHYSTTIDNKNTSNQDKYYSCSHRNYHGCPDNPEIKKKD